MDVRTKELIAIGASVTANCQPCLKYHIGKARENGAGDEEIKEAIAMAKKVRNGAMSQMEELIPTFFADTNAKVKAHDPACG